VTSHTATALKLAISMMVVPLISFKFSQTDTCALANINLKSLPGNLTRLTRAGEFRKRFEYVAQPLIAFARNNFT